LTCAVFFQAARSGSLAHPPYLPTWGLPATLLQKLQQKHHQATAEELQHLNEKQTSEAPFSVMTAMTTVITIITEKLLPCIVKRRKPGASRSKLQRQHFFGEDCDDSPSQSSLKNVSHVSSLRKPMLAVPSQMRVSKSLRRMPLYHGQRTFVSKPSVSSE
jgi:hypothetical protein